MAYADQQMSGNRVVAIVIVALIHIALGYALITGLAYEAATKMIERVTTIDVEEPPPPEEEPPPPPPDQPQVEPPPMAPTPPLNISPKPPEIATTPRIIERPVTPIALPTATATPTPVPTPAPTKSQARGAKPKGQSGWASRIQSNYPRRAERDGVEGNVGVRVSVGPDGRVSGCTVTSSSGSSDLDSGACDGMTRYARFDPALDDAGNPVTGSYSTQIQYRLN